MLAPWKKSYEQPRQDPLVKVMVFPVVMYGCDSWTIKKTVKELTFSNCIAGRLLRVPWTARRSNESILKEINSEYSWEGLMLKMKLQYFGHLMGRADSWEKTLMLGKKLTNEVFQWHHWLNGHESEQTQGDSERQGSLVCCSPQGHKELDMT